MKCILSDIRDQLDETMVIFFFQLVEREIRWIPLFGSKVVCMIDPIIETDDAYYEEKHIASNNAYKHVLPLNLQKKNRKLYSQHSEQLLKITAISSNIN